MNRPAIVNEYKRRRMARTRLKWQALRAGTVLATAGAAIFFTFFEEYSGVGGRGEHCFNGIRKYARGLYEQVVLGTAPAPPEGRRPHTVPFRPVVAAPSGTESAGGAVADRQE